MTCKCRNPNKHHSYISPRRRKIRHRRFMGKMYDDAINAMVEAEDKIILQMVRDMDQMELGGTDEFSEADDEAEAQPFRGRGMSRSKLVENQLMAEDLFTSIMPDIPKVEMLRFNPVEERRIVASFTIDSADLTAHYNPKAVKRGKRV